MGRVKVLPCFFMHLKGFDRFAPPIQRWKRDLLTVPDLGTSQLCSPPLFFPDQSICDYSGMLFIVSPLTVAFFFPTPASISSFLWITLLCSLMHMISMPRCYLISQQSSFGLEWAEQLRAQEGRHRWQWEEEREGKGIQIYVAFGFTFQSCAAKGLGSSVGGVEMATGGP